MLLLFAFIYWQTVVREQERIDGIGLGGRASSWAAWALSSQRGSDLG